MAELLQNVLGHAGRSSQHLAVRRGHRSRQDACKDESGEDCRQHTVLTDEAGDADDKGLTGRAAEEFQRTDPGHAEAHHADDDGRRHGDDHPDGGDAAAENQLLLVLDGHEAEQDVGHTEVAETPRHGGDDVQQAVGRGPAGHSVVAGRHGQVAGKALGILHHSAPAACHDDTVAQHRNEGQRHDHRLDEVGGGDGAEAAEDGIAHDDEGRHQHCCHVIYAEEAVEQLAAGRKARGRIRHEEDDDNDRAQSVQQVALVMEAKRQELRYRDGVEVGRIAAEPPGHDEPVEPGTQRKADGRPARRGNACQIGQTRHTHQQPAGHIAGLGAHGRDQRSHLPAAEVEVGAVVVGLAVGETHQKHGRKIDDDGDDDTDLTHTRSPFGAFSSMIKAWNDFTTVKHQSARPLGRFLPYDRNFVLCSVPNHSICQQAVLRRRTACWLG